MNHLTLLKSGIADWNQWRAKHPKASCNLAGQDLSGGYFFEGNFRRVNLQGANLRRACFIGADLRDANLSHTDLSGAYLGDANLQGANLSHANCEGTNLTRVNLQQTNLQGTRFSAENIGLAQGRVTASSQQSSSQVADGQSANSRTAIALRARQHAPESVSSQPRGAKLGLGWVAWVSIAAGLVLAIGLPFAFTRSNATQNDPPQNRTAQRDTDQDAQPDTSLVADAKPVAPLKLTQFLDSADQVWAVTTHTQENGDSLVISGGKDGLIEIWDRQTGETIRTLTGHTDTIRSLSVSKSGQWLVSGSGDGIKVWQPQTGELIHSLPLRKNGGPMFMQSPIWSVAISPDEKTFVSSAYDGHIIVWNLAEGKQNYILHIDSTVWSVAIAPDGQSFVTGSSDGTIRQWDLSSGELLQTFSGHSDAVRAVAISPDGETLASGSWDSSIKIWNLATGNLRTTLNGHEGRVVSIAISSDGNTLASGGTDNTLKLWNLTSGQLTKNLDNNSKWILAVDFALEERTLVSGGKDRTIKVWQ
ncbi:MAG: pentapeptide repeat-containing protein [Phormidesmis sp.]